MCVYVRCVRNSLAVVVFFIVKSERKKFVAEDMKENIWMIFEYSNIFPLFDLIPKFAAIYSCEFLNQIKQQENVWIFEISNRNQIFVPSLEEVVWIQS